MFHRETQAKLVVNADKPGPAGHSIKIITPGCHETSWRFFRSYEAKYLARSAFAVAERDAWQQS